MMKIRAKLSIIFGCAWLLIIGLIYLESNFLLTRLYTDTEYILILVITNVTVLFFIWYLTHKFVLIAHDDLEKRIQKRTQDLDYMAHHDALTTLPNRLLFNELLIKAIANAKRHEQKLAVICLDLDRFKTINDTLGHDAGDKYLQNLAQKLKTTIRTEDVVARFGGDEFVFCLTELNKINSLDTIAQKILNIIQEPQIIQDKEFKLSASLGVSIFPDSGTTISELVKNADMAMYRAKKAGGNNHDYYTNTLHTEAKEALDIEIALRDAIPNNELKLFYQPIVDLKHNIIVGMEVLLRWQHPIYGLLSPEQFIAVAETSNQIYTLGEWVFKTACAKNNLLSGFISVNFSATQFLSAHFIDFIKTTLKETNTNAEKIVIEITENVLIKAKPIVVDKLNQLCKMGIKIAIDDFGMGYSSLHCLKEFPLHYLKIARNFIQDIPKNKKNSALTNSIINMAHNLELITIAEGIETKPQLTYLKQQNCDLGQGFLFSKPVEEAGLHVFLGE
jgi:diguanylate cyclase (GGDEF)-like protein